MQKQKPTFINPERLRYIFLMLTGAVVMSACQRDDTLTGTWESVGFVSRVDGKAISKEIKTGSSEYYKLHFEGDSIGFFLGSSDHANVTLPYRFHNDTLWIITGRDGGSKPNPATIRNHDEFHIRELSGGDSAVRIFRKVR